MNIYEEIRNNAGINEDEYISEGIVFFKNSNKMKRLSKKLMNKHVHLVKQNKSQEATALNILIQEINSIAKKFEEVENKFKLFSKNNNKVKQEYSELEKDFEKLLNVAKKESMKRMLIATGTAALVVGVLAAGAFGFHSLQSSGVLDNAVSNIQNRMGKSDMMGKLQYKTGDSQLDVVGKGLSQAVTGTVMNQVIRATNQDLVATASVAGATAAGVLSVGVIGQLRKIGQDNKTIAATVSAIEDIKAAEKKTTMKKDSEGDESD